MKAPICNRRDSQQFNAQQFEQHVRADAMASTVPLSQSMSELGLDATILETDDTTLIEIDRSFSGQYIQCQRVTNEHDDIHHLYIGAKQYCYDRFAVEYPDFEMDVKESHDKRGVIFYSRLPQGSIDGMLRVVFNSTRGLPMEKSIPDQMKLIRAAQLSVAEPGRFAIDPKASIFRRFIRGIYDLAKVSSVNLYVMQVREEHSDFYKRVFGARPIYSELATPGCVNLIWNIAKTPPVFFRMFGGPARHESMQSNRSTSR